MTLRLVAVGILIGVGVSWMVDEVNSLHARDTYAKDTYDYILCQDLDGLVSYYDREIASGYRPKQYEIRYYDEQHKYMREHCQ